jgi:hypothetical protein
MPVNGMGMGNAGTSSAGQSFISTLIARMPYTYKVLQNAIEANPKYDLFNNMASRKEQRIRQQSISQANDQGGAGMMMLDKRYHQIMYADVDTDKVRRLAEYRKMAGYSELAECIEEICDEAIVTDDQNEIVKMTLKGKHDKVIVDAVKDEWVKFIQNFDLENKGWEIINQFLVEGELFFENVISEERPDYGIVGVMRIPTELINVVYNNLQNQMIQGYLLRKPIINPKRTISNQSEEELIILDKNQITYMQSGMWNEDRTIRLPYIENSRRAYKQLSLVEDSIIIYRLVRAPERLVFKVDVGNMSVPRAEEYIKKLMQQYWTRKNFDSSQNRVGNVYDPQSMLDAYWFTKRGQSEGTTVEQLAGGCLSMNTKIPLLDGRELTLAELTEEYNKGKQNWIYSCNPENGHIVPGKISWAGVTQESAKVMKLTFDNDETLICTPDHKFPTMLNGKKRADQLCVGDSIYPLNRRNKKINAKTAEYEQIYQHDTKEWEFTHRNVVNVLNPYDIIIENIINENDSLKRSTIHHKDFNRFNNDPQNLALMSNKDHYKLHSEKKPAIIKKNIAKGLKKYWKNTDPEIKAKRKKLITELGREWRKNATPEQKQKYIEKQRIRSSERFNKIPSLRSKIAEISVETWKDPVIREKRVQNITNRWKDPEYRKKACKNRGLVCTENALKALITIINDNHVYTQNDIIEYVRKSSDNVFSAQFFKDNQDRNWKKKITVNNLRFFIKQHGYKNHNQFIDEIGVFNHRITKIEHLADPIEVGTLTIDKNEEYHNYHTFALGCGIFTFNSNLGQLDDLMYFVKKLYRSLKVPVSRLDPADPFKDGTEITREELKFARFIIRIQNQIAQGLRQSFITHLQLREKDKYDTESKSLWQKFNLREHHVSIKFNPPSYFATMREQQIFDLKSNNFQKLTGSELISQSFAQKYYLGLTDDQMAENREWLRKDAALSWEIQNIVSSGPDFRKQMAAMADLENVAQGGIPGGMATDAGSLLPGQGELPPEFGPGPENPAGAGAGAVEEQPPPVLQQQG